MFILIAHRGNINGPNTEKENTIEYIEEAIKQNFDCEIDIWLINDLLYLGHDKPEHHVSIEWLNKYHDKLWIHCKNIESLCFIKAHDFNCFFHDKDTYTITSKQFIWGNINSIINENIICVMPELYTQNVNPKKALGICSDYISNYIDACYWVRTSDGFPHGSLSAAPLTARPSTLNIKEK